MIANALSAMRERTGARKVIATPYTDADLSDFRAIIDQGQGGARGLQATTRVRALRAIDALIIRDPQRLGQMITRSKISHRDESHVIMDLVAYANGRR
jgi:hypothetical protein